MQFDLDQFEKRCAGMTTEEVGADLLMHVAYWRNEGPLDNDDKKNARICRMSARKFHAFAPVIKATFKVIVDGAKSLLACDVLDHRISEATRVYNARKAVSDKANAAKAAKAAKARKSEDLQGQAAGDLQGRQNGSQYRNSSSSTKKKNYAPPVGSAAMRPAEPPVSAPGWEAEDPRWAGVREYYDRTKGPMFWKYWLASARPADSDPKLLLCESQFAAEKLDSEYGREISRIFGAEVFFQADPAVVERRPS